MSLLAWSIIMTATKEVMCLFVCFKQDYLKSCDLILIKLSGTVGFDTQKNPVNFGAHMDRGVFE